MHQAMPIHSRACEAAAAQDLPQCMHQIYVRATEALSIYTVVIVGTRSPVEERYTWGCSRWYLKIQHWHPEIASSGDFAANVAQNAYPHNVYISRRLATQTKTALLLGNGLRLPV